MTRTSLLARGLVAAGVCTTLAAWALIGPFFMPGADGEGAELLRFLPWPLLLLPALAAVLAGFALGWRWRIAALLALALAAVDTLDLRIGQADAGVLPLRVMTWNAKAFVATRSTPRDAAIAAEIRRQSPDVLMLQDVTDYGRAGAPLPWPIQQALQGYHVVRRWQYLIASRAPLRDCGLIPLGPDGPDGELAMRCSSVLHGRPLELVNVHLISPRAGLRALLDAGPRQGWPRWRANQAARRHQADQLARALGPAAGPRIVAGDLNAIDASPVLRPLHALGLRDAFAHAGRGYGPSFGHAVTGFDWLRIDHVLVDASIGVRDARVVDSTASEHRPLVVELWLQRR